MKLRWVRIHEMIYVEDFEDDYDHCRRCAFNSDELIDYCGETPNCESDGKSNVWIPLEPQHIPNLRKKGKTKWQRN